ncbi:hypothetical protein [Streptomyces sp. NPDC046985]|uniref:hypothetical protein n=1 Tax=Streptomyces sp. NPDC046985 TaxID=3155377 RepID=UPI00340E3A41
MPSPAPTCQNPGNALRRPGPLDIRTDEGASVDPGGPRPRALLTLLLLDAGRTVAAERLTDGLYGTEPPAGAAAIELPAYPAV